MALLGVRAVWIQPGMVVDATLARHLAGVTLCLKAGATVSAPLSGLRAVLIEPGMDVDAIIARQLAGVDVYLREGARVSAPLLGVRTVCIAPGMDVGVTIAPHLADVQVHLRPGAKVSAPLSGVRQVLIEQGMDVDAIIAPYLADVQVHLREGARVSAPLSGVRAVFIEPGMDVDAIIARQLAGVDVYLKPGAGVSAPLRGVNSVWIEPGMVVDATLAVYLAGVQVHVEQGAQGPAYEIHNAARNFNDEALEILKDHLSSTALLGYDDAKTKIQETFEGMLQNRTKDKKLYGDYLAQETLNWAMECNAEAADKNILSLVITYLLSKGDYALKIWLSTFLEESALAYSNSQNGKSCVKGVKERVVTSLRTVSNNPEKLAALIEKTEKELLLPFKLQKLGTDEILHQLKEFGLESKMNEDEALKSYLTFLTDVYFEGDMAVMGNKKVQEAIKAITDIFEGEDGLWAKWKLKLTVLENSVAACCGVENGKE